ncbi:hypothetical protein I549_1083 [Mycobacterium avium subsp. avium 2285 (R)]|nr:hypothetical protein I549_1083 [Mycobacterium avium subsp. avium 2285 (R)]
MVVVAAGGVGGGADRLRHFPLADPAPAQRVAGLDAVIRQHHPGRAGITGAVLAVVRPDVALICVPAGLAIGSSGLGPIGDWMAALFFVAVAASSVAIPILAYLAAGSRLDDALARLRDWMDRNNAALLAAVLVVIGAMVLYHGIDAL